MLQVGGRKLGNKAVAENVVALDGGSVTEDVIQKQNKFFNITVYLGEVENTVP